MRAQLITLQSFKVFCRTFGHVFMYFTSNLWLKYSPKQDLLVSRVCPIKSHNFNTVLTNKKIYSQLATWKKILYFFRQNATFLQLPFRRWWSTNTFPHPSQNYNWCAISKDRWSACQVCNATLSLILYNVVF